MLLRACLGSAAVLLACSAPTAPAPTHLGATDTDVADVPAAPAPTGRLGDDVVPVAYRLSLAIDPERGQFGGAVEIDVAIRRPASSVWLHGVDLSVGRASLRRGAAETALVPLPAPAGAEVIGFDFGRTLAPGPATLRIEFRASFGSAEGVFRQPYRDQWYVYTDFEPVDARRGFPCFDDPRFKTPWTVTLSVPDHLRAFSNTPVADQRTDGGRAIVTFEPTPALPSYLVAFAVGAFEVVGHGRDRIRIITFADLTSEAVRALATARALLPRAEAWVDMAMPFRKLDFIAVPVFDGAMENPGLVTVASAILHMDPDDPPPAAERLMTMVVAHEIAHLWFGDLVTMAWWDDLWLNEGFATYLADELIEAWKPEWHWHLEREAARWRAHDADSLAGVRAVRQPATTTEEIRAAFDVITYVKGGAVLEMLEHWLGDRVFRDGARRYLRAHAGKNASTDDLVRALDAAAGRDVGAVLRSFVSQPGMPLLEAPAACKDGRRTRPARQTPYRLVGEAAPDRRWVLPPCAPSGYLLPAPAAPTTDREAIRQLEAIRGRLRSGRLTPERAAEGVAAIANRGLHGPAAERLAQTATELEALVGGRSPALARAARAAIAPLGWRRVAGERIDDREARPLVMALYARYHRVPAATRAAARRWLDRRTGIDDELVGATLAAVAAGGDARLHRRILGQLAGERRESHREALVDALASFTDRALLARSLEWARAGDTDRADAARLLYRAAENPRTRGQAFAFITRHRLELEGQFRLTPILARFACTDTEAATAAAMLDGFSPKARDLRRALAQVRSEYQTCRRLRRHYRATEARVP